MKVFLIIVAVLAVIIALILSLSATLTLVYDNGWHTKIKVLFIEKNIVLSEILSFILFPQKKAEEVIEENKIKKEAAKKQKNKAAAQEAQKEIEQAEEKIEQIEAEENEKKAEEKNAQPKSNPIKKLWDKEGIVGILSLVSNLLETANSAVLTLFRGLHIYSLYVMIIVGGGDADQIARSYGKICSIYYPIKGIILNGMKVDNYDDYIQPDFIAERTEFQMQFIGSISVGLLLKVALKAGFVFLKNLIKNK
ncbi:MAG: hypothetical protein ACI4IQ_04010 [Eubacterium sp.]